MAETADAVVVGGGVIGGCVAYALAREGLRVCLFERESLGSGASGHGHGAIGLLGKDFKPGPYFELGLAGARMYPAFVEQVVEDGGIDVLYHELPGLGFALVEEEERIYRDCFTWQQQYLDLAWIDVNECRQLEPRLTPHAIGGVLYKHGQVDGYRLSLATAQAVEWRGGRVLLREATGLQREGNRIVGVTYPGGAVSCESVVLATGAWVHRARAWLDFPVPVRPLHGEVLHVRLPGEPMRVFVMTARHGPLLQRRDGILMVGSIGGVSMTGADVDTRHVFDPRDNIPPDFDLEPKAANRDHMLERAVRVMPAIEEAQLVAHLAGVRPLCADRMPLIGAVPGLEGVYLATGHGTKGIHLAPITGRIVADLIVRGRSDVPVPVAAFSPGRFAYLLHAN